MKKILFLFLLITSTIQGQINWRQLPPNPFIPSSVTSYEIGYSDNNHYYMMYTYYNSSTFNFDLQIDHFSPGTGWNILTVFPTTSNTNTIVKSISNGGVCHVAVNSNNTTNLTLFRLSGNSIALQNTQIIPGFDPYANWELVPGSGFEVYLSFISGGIPALFQYQSGLGSWANYGDPFNGQGISPTKLNTYVSADSVFVAGRYFEPTGDQIRMMAANKITHVFSPYNPPISNVYALNAGVVDTIQGTDDFFIYGDGNDYTSIIAKDNSSPIDFKLEPLGTYGERVPFPLDFDFSTQVSSNEIRTFLLTTDATQADNHVVFSKTLPNGTWSQFATSGYAPNGIFPNSNKLKAQNSFNIGSTKIVSGYIDFTPTPAEYVFQVSNSAPTIHATGTTTTTLCANQYTNIINNLVIEDLDFDLISFVSLTSSNNAVIDPTSLVQFINTISPEFTDYYADITTGSVTVPTNVTLTFTFTDGFDILQYPIVVTVNPNPAVVVFQNTLSVCSNGDLINLADNVGTPGGNFVSYGVTIENGFINPANLLIGLTSINYIVNQNGCVSTAFFDINTNEAPVASIATINASACNATDGQLDATITSSGSYEFVWENGNFTDLTRFNLPAGEYRIDVVDEYGCISEATALIENNAAIITGNITNISCVGAADGAIDVSISNIPAPYTTIWSNGYSTEDVSMLQPGTHTILITDANNCTSSKNFFITEPFPISTFFVENLANCSAADGGLTNLGVNGGTAPYTFLWNTGETTADLTNKPAGVYSLTITDANNCVNSFIQTISNPNAPYIIGQSIVPTACTQSTGSVTLDTIHVGTNVQFLWSNSAPTLNQINLPASNLSIDLFNSEGCHTFKAITIESQTPTYQPICLVTVDSVTSTNLVVWEKTQPSYISHYNIFRETLTPNEYMLIDTVQNTNLSIFNDVIASPISHSWRYRITAQDVCGKQSTQSTAHKTMHLSAIDEGNGNFKVVWNFYFGVSYSGFKLYRYTFQDGWVEIATLPSTLNNYIDTPPSILGLDYMVELVTNSTCTADITKAQDFNTTRSNRDKGSFSVAEGTGDSNNSLSENGDVIVSVYPNPVHNELILSTSENAIGSIVSILNVDGVTVRTVKIAQSEMNIDMSELAAGMYYLTVNGLSKTISVVKN